MEWGDDGKVFIFNRNDLCTPLTSSTPREEIKPGRICGVAQTWQSYIREKSKEELDKVISTFPEKSKAELDKLRKGTTFCVYTRGALGSPDEAVVICKRDKVGGKTDNYTNAFTGLQENEDAPPHFPYRYLVLTDMPEAIHGSKLIGCKPNDPVCDSTDAMLVALWSLQRLCFRHLAQEVWDIAMEEEDPLNGSETALYLSNKYKNLICNPEFWKIHFQISEAEMRHHPSLWEGFHMSYEQGY